MEIVSFEVAKAIKEAGYPQGKTAKVYLLEDYGLFKKGLDIFNKLDNSYNKADIPTYLEVYLWLWNELGIKFIIDLDEDGAKCYGRVNDVIIDESGDDPEEAIKQAIEYLVTNNLIK